MAVQTLKLISILFGSLTLTALIFLLSLLIQGQRPITQIENIHGIKYPIVDNSIIINEKLAHFDIELSEPVLDKQLTLDLSFSPNDVSELNIGVRENDFWLSYDWIPLLPSPNQSIITRQIVIPLSDKFQDTDRSIDVIFSTGQSIDPHWELHQLSASVQLSSPTLPELKNYLASILKRERAL